MSAATMNREQFERLLILGVETKAKDEGAEDYLVMVSPEQGIHKHSFEEYSDALQYGSGVLRILGRDSFSILKGDDVISVYSSREIDA